jgi:hypothetical protein
MKQKLSQYLAVSVALAGLAVGFGSTEIFAAINHSHSIVAPKAKGTPGPCTDVVVTSTEPREDGTADVTITFTTPTTYCENYDKYEGLDELTQVALCQLNRSTWSYEVVQSIENPEIGKQYSFTLENLASGYQNYVLIASNSASPELDSNYDGRAYVYAYVGADTPGEVGNLVVNSDSYPDIKISWDAPSQGQNGGYVNPAEFTYTVVRYISWENQETIASGITETSCTDHVEFDKLTEYRYIVYATNSQGDGAQLYSESLVLGPAATLPFSESFPTGNDEYIWTQASTSYSLYPSTYISQWGNGAYTAFGYFANGYDEDYGALLFNTQANTWGDQVYSEASYTSCDIDISTADSPALSFYHYVWPSAENTLKSSVGIIQNGETTVLKEFTYTEGAQGWNLEVLPLTQFVGKGNIKIVFAAGCDSYSNGFAAFDCIKVDELLTKDMQIKSIYAPAKVDAGTDFNVAVTVLNGGAEKAEGYTVTLYKDGEACGTQSGDALEIGGSATLNYPFTADNSYNENTSFNATVTFDGDQKLDNNESEEAIVAVRHALVPAVDDLVGDVEDLNVNLSWTEPDYQLPIGENVVEGFEDCKDTATSIDNWTQFDDDTHYPMYLINYGLNYADWQDESFAFIVLDESTLSVSDTSKWLGKAHSGSKYLFTCSGSWGTLDSWLVSPELSGNAQTLEFYAVSNQYPTLRYTSDDGSTTIKDQIKVLVSFTTTDKEAFTYTALCDATDNTLGYEINSSLADGGDYEKISVELPEGAKYFAVEVVTPYVTNSMLFFDDFSFEQKQTGIQVSLLGYDVYDGDRKLNSDVLTATEYTDAVEAGTAHSYSVVALYNVGASESSNVLEVTVSSSSIERLTAAANATVKGANGNIYVTAPVGVKATIVDITGRVIAKTSGNATVSVVPGNYLVTIAGKTVKINVK